MSFPLAWIPKKSAGVQTLIDGATGTIIGNMTDTVGGRDITKAFDASTNNTNVNSALKLDVVGTVGKQWSGAKTLTGFKWYGPNDSSPNGGGAVNVTIILQGSNDGSAWTDLYTDGPTSRGTSASVSILTGITPGSYTYHRLHVTVASGNNFCTECQFYEDI